jgi:hypothetical protein
MPFLPATPFPIDLGILGCTCWSVLCLADTLQVWKRGLRVRVDGTLVGVDKESGGMLPQWKRGGEDSEWLSS